MLRTRPTPTLFFSCRSRARKDRLRILGMRLLLRWRQGSAQGADSQVRSLGESTGGNGRSLYIRTHVRILDGS